ncbi:MAG: hypothetical protein ACE5KM_01810 [Planctomycetaceae bacterium]
MALTLNGIVAGVRSFQSKKDTNAVAGPLPVSEGTRTGPPKK